jgi:hypothetical protein
MLVFCLLKGLRGEKQDSFTSIQNFKKSDYAKRKYQGTDRKYIPYH